MNDIYLVVTPEELDTLSEDLTAKINKAHKQFDLVDDELIHLANSWEGEGYNAMYQKYKSRKADYDKAFDNILEHVNKLILISQGYKDVEVSNKETAYQLPDEIIF